MYPGLDGTFREIEYFKCKQGYGLLLPLDVIKHDDRFVTYLAPISTPPTTLKSSGATPHALTAAPQGSPTLATVTPPMVMDRSQSSPSHPLCEPVAMPRKSNTCSESSAPKDVLLKCLLEVFDTTGTGLGQTFGMEACMMAVVIDCKSPAHTCPTCAHLQ